MNSDTTRFSGVEFQFQPTIQPTTSNEDTTCFSSVEFQFQPTIALEIEGSDTTRFSGVESQFQPTNSVWLAVLCRPNLMAPHVASLAAAYQLHFYLLFKTYYRRPLFVSNDASSLLTRVLTDVCSRKNYHLLETNIDPDNVGLLVSLNPSQSVSETVRFLKGNVSRQFGLEFGSLLKAHDLRSVWAQGYFARTSGKVNLEAARNYVDAQVSHHGYRGSWTKALKYRNPNFKSPAFTFDHSVAILDYHLVLATQNRLPVFDDETIAPRLFNYILKIGRKHNFAVDRIGLLPDHMHLIIEAVPNLAIQNCVVAILENTRDWMTRNYATTLKQLDAWDVWQPSFYAGSVGAYSTAQVREFLRRR